MWILKYDGPGWIYTKSGATIELRYEDGQVIIAHTSWWFPVKPTKRQLRQARKTNFTNEDTACHATA